MDPDETHAPDERIPCPDDMCTGVLGEGGRCGTCGRGAGEGARARAAGEPEAQGEGGDARGEAAAEKAGGDAVEAEGPPVRAGDAGEAETAPGERVPCADDMCTGVLGADGRCGTCGRAG